jgi:NADP-dependent 3-hydroxy acid dehydrogenase YdfG
MNLSAETVVVIGAGAGIGRAVAVDAASAGATLILGERTAPPLEETARLAGGALLM